MSILYSIVLGIIQGLTEFWPISSSGHLLIFHEILPLNLTDNLAFDTSLHLGTLLALLIYFYNDIIVYFQAFLKSLQKWELKTDINQRLAWLILISVLPAGFFGYFFETIITYYFRNILLVCLTLIIVGFLFLIAEKYTLKTQTLSSLNWTKSLFIGLAQVLALIPGVSRSGITIISGMALNLKREEAARFSFLISIPIVFVAGAKKTFDLMQSGLNQEQIIIYALGFLTAAIFGYLAIKYLLDFLKNHSLNIFAYYRIILGLLVLLYFVLK
jgi:undecaprenyl-diphosphatase